MIRENEIIVDNFAGGGGAALAKTVGIARSGAGGDGFVLMIMENTDA